MSQRNTKSEKKWIGKLGQGDTKESKSNEGAVMAGTDLSLLARVWIDGRKARGELSGRSGTVEASRLVALLQLAGSPVDLDRHLLLRWQATIGQCAPATRRHAVSTVARFCQWLVIEGHLETDPTLTLMRVKEPRRVPRALSSDDVARVIGACPDRRTLVIVWLMVGLGLRCVEVSNADLHDYDDRARTLQVRGKAGHERVLPVPDTVAAALAQWIEVRGWFAGPLITPAPKGWKAISGRVSAQRISIMVQRVMRSAGVHSPGDGRTAHSLRHTAASDVLDACHDIRVVQEMLGHTSVATTQIYLRRADLGRLRTAMAGRNYPPAA